MSGHRNLPPAALHSLSATERSVLELLDRGLTKTEISLCLDRTLGTVMRAVRTARQKYRDEINRKALGSMKGAPAFRPGGLAG